MKDTRKAGFYMHWNDILPSEVKCLATTLARKADMERQSNMTKDVLITISGVQKIDGELHDPIETVTPGEYYFRNGKHCIL